MVHGRLLALMLHLQGADRALQRCHCFQRNRLTGRILQIDLREGRGIGLEAPVRLDNDLIVIDRGIDRGRLPCAIGVEEGQANGFS